VLIVSSEEKRVFVGRIRHFIVGRVGRIKGVYYGGEVKAENKS
jgi:hypothetical protein